VAESKSGRSGVEDKKDSTVTNWPKKPQKKQTAEHQAALGPPIGGFLKEQ